LATNTQATIEQFLLLCNDAVNTPSQTIEGFCFLRGLCKLVAAATAAVSSFETPACWDMNLELN
jgi:hypothetical protein